MLLPQAWANDRVSQWGDNKQSLPCRHAVRTNKKEEKGSVRQRNRLPKQGGRPLPSPKEGEERQHRKGWSHSTRQTLQTTLNHGHRFWDIRPTLVPLEDRRPGTTSDARWALWLSTVRLQALIPTIFSFCVENSRVTPRYGDEEVSTYIQIPTIWTHPQLLNVSPLRLQTWGSTKNPWKLQPL